MSIGYEIVKGLCIGFGILGGISFFGSFGGYGRMDLTTIQFLVQLAASTGTVLVSYVLYHVTLYAERTHH